MKFCDSKDNYISNIELDKDLYKQIGDDMKMRPRDIQYATNYGLFFKV